MVNAMIRTLLYSCLLLTLCGSRASSAPNQQDLRIEASVTYSEIFLGETVHLMLNVHGYQPSFGQPDLSALPADTQLIGQQDRSQQSIQIVNGVRKVQNFSGRIFTYRIRPDKPGTFRFSPIILRGPNDKPIPVNEPTILVRPIPEQDIVKIQIHAPTNHIIPDESFDVSLWIDIRKPPQPYQAYSPIPNGTHPQLQIPYLNQETDQALESEDISQLLRSMLVREGEAFRINGHMLERDPFGGMFGRDQAALFQLPRTSSQENPDYYRYALTVNYLADREGNFTFGPVRFRGKVITNVTTAGKAELDSLYAISPSVTVKVQNPPAKGRPATYLGASGNHLKIETSLDTQNCLIGDPVTMTVEITGDGPTHRIRNLRPATLQPLENDFRVQLEPIDAETISNGKRYSYLIRPRKAGTLEIPALAVSFFNLASRTYNTVKSDPLPIRVNPTTELESETISDMGQGSMQITMSAALGNLPPAPFYQEHKNTKQGIFRPVMHILLLLIGPGFLFVALGLRWMYRITPALRRSQKRKRAYEYAKRELHQPQCDPSKIIRAYMTDMLDDSFARGDETAMKNALRAAKINQELQESIMKIITEDAYTGTDDREKKKEEVYRILKVASAHFAKKQKKKRWHAFLTLPFFLTLILAQDLPAFANDVFEFERKRSNQLIHEAKQTKEFLAAADALAERVTQGNRNPIILYNLGTALLMGEQPSLAIPVLQWSERRGAPSWIVRRNMLVARRMISQNPTLQLPWIRKLLFWHFGTSLSSRITISFILFSCVWIAATLRWLWNWKLRGMPMLYLLMILSSISVAASLYAEYQDDQDWPALHDKIQHIVAMYEEDDAT